MDAVILSLIIIVLAWYTLYERYIAICEQCEVDYQPPLWLALMLSSLALTLVLLCESYWYLDRTYTITKHIF